MESGEVFLKIRAKKVEQNLGNDRGDPENPESPFLSLEALS
ncbi:MAG: hypothetical protein ACK58N_17575 [Synechocystis sp.]